MRRSRRPRVSDFWSPPGRDSAAIATRSCGIPARAKLTGLAGSGRSPRALESRDGALARARRCHSRLMERSRCRRPARWMLGGRCIAGTAFSNGSRSSMPPFTFARPACRYRRSSATTSSGISRLFRQPGSGVEECRPTQCAPMHRADSAPQIGDIFRNPDLARTYRCDCRGRARGFLRRAHRAHHRCVLQADRRVAELRGSARSARRVGRAARDFVSRGRCLRHGREHPGARDAADAEHPGTFRPARDGLPVGRLDPRAGRGQASRLRGPRPLLRRSALFEDSGRVARAPRPTPPSARSSFGPIASCSQVAAGEPPAAGDTTYLTVADSSGMMVSMIQSNYRGMGSGLVADGLGFMFQDRGQMFALEDGHPNLYQPGKRPFHTIIPGFAARDGRPWMSFGVMGADMQPQGQTQIVVNRVDFGLDVQAAGDSPRWHHVGSLATHGRGRGGTSASSAGCTWRAAFPSARGARSPASAGRSARRTARSGATSASSIASAAASAYMPPQAKCGPMESRSRTSPQKWAGVC